MHYTFLQPSAGLGWCESNNWYGAGSIFIKVMLAFGNFLYTMGAVVKLNRSIHNMTKLASLVLFASILTAANLQELRTTSFEASFEKNDVTNSLSKSVGESKLVSVTGRF
jgi:hypothetical protein